MLLKREGEVYSAARYLRLSSEDGDRPESNSITNQRELIKAYMKSHADLSFAEEYVDDGYTGTNFERPAFQQMMNDIQSGRINCIVVKDLSRLGRNYIEMGKLMERIFPVLGVRFIAINDHYDNIETENDSSGIIIPFKNLLNDAYSRDISIKVRSQLETKRRNGDFVSGFAAFGYKKSSENKNKLVIDEAAAQVVRAIFEMKLSGKSAGSIARHLNAQGVPSPAEYKRSLGSKYHSGFQGHGQPKWQAIQVLRILNNPLYYGEMVQGKKQKVNYKVQKLRDIPNKQWVRVKNAHEPIISQETFELVQQVMKMDTCAGEGEDYVKLFSGIVRCADCDRGMVRRVVTTSTGKKYAYLHCGTYQRGLGCSSHLIREEKLYHLVKEELKAKILEVSDYENRISRLAKSSYQERAKRVDTERLVEAEKIIEKYSELSRQAYEDMLKGIITKDEYHSFRVSFQEKIDKAKQTHEQEEDRRERLINAEVNQFPWIEVFKKYLGFEEIDRKMLVELIECIHVDRKKEIHIRYRHQREMDEIKEYCSEER